MARLYGLTGADQIARSHVLIVGIGGVGSWIAEALARSGVGEMTLVDMDHIAESNINRQIHALESTLGQAKVVAMKERIAQINSECQLLTRVSVQFDLRRSNHQVWPCHHSFDWLCLFASRRNFKNR